MNLRKYLLIVSVFFTLYLFIIEVSVYGSTSTEDENCSIQSLISCKEKFQDNKEEFINCILEKLEICSEILECSIEAIKFCEDDFSCILDGIKLCIERTPKSERI